MTGNEFLKRVRRLAKRNDLTARYEAHGKGSHGRLYYGDRFTTMKDPRKELGKGLLKAMCSQLGIDAEEL